MPLQESSLEQRMLSELAANGVAITGPHAKIPILINAIAKAVVDEIIENAQVSGMKIL